MLSQLLDAPAFQIHRQLEESDSVWAADRPRAGHHPTGRLDLLQELRKHCRGGRMRGFLPACGRVTAVFDHA